MNRYCIYCGSPLPEEALFCPACGKRQAAIPESEPSLAPPAAESAPSTPKSPTDKRLFVANLVRASLILAISLVLLVMSFLPVFTVKSVVSDDVTLETKVSAIDSIVFLFDSFYKWDTEELASSKLADEIADLYEEMMDEDVDLDNESSITERYEKYHSRYTVLLARCELRSENTKSHAGYVILAVMALLYILFAVILVVFATLSFVAAFGPMAGKKKILDRLALGFLAAMPAITLVFYSAFVLFAPLGQTRYAMAGGAVCILVFSAFAIVCSTIYAFIFKQHNGRFNIPLRALTLVFSLAIILLALSPVVTNSVKCEFEGRSSKTTVDIPVNPSIFSCYHFSDEQRDTWEELCANKTLLEKQKGMEEIFAGFEDYTKKEASIGLADDTNKLLLITLTGLYFTRGPLEVVSYVSIIYFVLIALAATVFFETVFRFIGGVSLRRTLLIMRILTLLFSVFALASGIAYTVYANIFIDRYAPISYNVSFGVGIAFALALAIAILCFPDESKRNKKPADDYGIGYTPIYSEASDEVVEVSEGGECPTE